MTRTESELAKGWLAYQRAPRAGTKSLAPEYLFEFVTELDDLVRIDPERSWRVIQVILMNARDDLERACLAAGPLEDLLVFHGPKFIERLEAAAATDATFRELLTGVWRNGMAAPVWDRVQRAAARG